jgi:hypothetical protein
MRVGEEKNRVAGKFLKSFGTAAAVVFSGQLRRSRSAIAE